MPLTPHFRFFCGFPQRTVVLVCRRRGRGRQKRRFPLPCPSHPSGSNTPLIQRHQRSHTPIHSWPRCCGLCFCHGIYREATISRTVSLMIRLLSYRLRPASPLSGTLPRHLKKYLIGNSFLVGSRVQHGSIHQGIPSPAESVPKHDRQHSRLGPKFPRGVDYASGGGETQLPHWAPGSYTPTP